MQNQEVTTLDPYRLRRIQRARQTVIEALTVDGVLPTSNEALKAVMPQETYRIGGHYYLTWKGVRHLAQRVYGRAGKFAKPYPQEVRLHYLKVDPFQEQRLRERL